MTFTREQIDAAARELYGARATYDPAQVERALDAAAATPTPPADDVLEARANALALIHERFGNEVRDIDTFDVRDLIVDAVAADRAREVRPRGPLDVAECEVVYGEPVSPSARQTIEALRKLAQMGVVTITGKGGAIEVLQEDRS